MVLALTAALIAIAFFVLTKRKKEKKSRSFGLQYIRQLQRFSWVKKLDAYLKGNGKPLGMSGDLLIAFHILFLAIGSIQLMNRQFSTLRLTVMFILLLDALVILQAGKHKKQLAIELCNIQDIVYYQSKINTPQDVILAYAVQHCNEPLKTPLNELLNKYKYMGGEKDLPRIYEEFRSTSNLMELQSFGFTLEQKEISGFSEQNHKAQAVMLKRAKRLRRKVGRQSKRFKLIIASVLLFICYVGFIIIPIGKELMNKLNLIFN